MPASPSQGPGLSPISRCSPAETRPKSSFPGKTASRTFPWKRDNGSLLTQMLRRDPGYLSLMTHFFIYRNIWARVWPRPRRRSSVLYAHLVWLIFSPKRIEQMFAPLRNFSPRPPSLQATVPGPAPGEPGSLVPLVPPPRVSCPRPPTGAGCLRETRGGLSAWLGGFQLR